MFGLNALSLSLYYGGLMALLTAVSLSVVLLFGFILNSRYSFRLAPQSQEIEVGLILIPALLLLVSGWCSLMHLYCSSSSNLNPMLTVKITAHQWFWEYQYAGNPESVNSYMTPVEELKVGESRLLASEQRLILPINCPIRLIFTSADLGHAWALPSHLLKVDCWPGVLNVLHLRFEQVGVFSGQCSELCGAGHPFMPTVVEVTPFAFFLVYIAML